MLFTAEGGQMGEYTGDWSERQLLVTQRLRQRRADLGLTQKQVVTRLARSGVRTTNRAVSSLEHGAGVDVARLPDLAAALECTVTYLVGLTTDPHRWEPDAVPADAALRRSSAQRAPIKPGRIPSGATASTAESLILGTTIPERRSARSGA